MSLQGIMKALTRKPDLSEELESHLRMAMADRVARGESPTEARRAAMRELGNVPLIADVTRGRWGWLRLEHLLQDIRFALRQLRKSPGFTAVSILTLTIGIAANTTIFSVMEAVVFCPLPFGVPDRLVCPGTPDSARLIPVYGHRYLVCSPSIDSGPVLSIWDASNAIVYGKSLLQYLERVGAVIPAS